MVMVMVVVDEGKGRGSPSNGRRRAGPVRAQACELMGPIWSLSLGCRFDSWRRFRKTFYICPRPLSSTGVPVVAIRNSNAGK